MEPNPINGIRRRTTKRTLSQKKWLNRCYIMPEAPKLHTKQLEQLVAHSEVVIRITEALDIETQLSQWLDTTTTELRLLSEQINFTLKVVENK